MPYGGLGHPPPYIRRTLSPYHIVSFHQFAMKFLLTAVLVSAAAAATTDSARCVHISEPNRSWTPD